VLSKSIMSQTPNLPISILGGKGQPIWECGLRSKRFIRRCSSKPYDDCEQGWQIIIFKKRNYVYILQGNEPTCTNFNVWYKVRIEDYLNNWNNLIEYLKENMN
jgi:hypothetical protein